MTKEDLAHRFDYHRPDERKATDHQIVRNELKVSAGVLDALLPEGREKALALTKLEEAMFWANAAVARS